MPDLNEEYRTATTGAGWFDRHALGRLAFEGRDATSFLHALVSADIESVPAGGGAYATYLTPQGRMITDVTLYRLADRWLAVLPIGQATALVSRFDSVIFTEDVRVSDVSATIGQISVVGPAASVAVGRATGTDASHLEALVTHGHLEKGGVTIARTDAAIVPSFDLFAAADRIPALTAKL